MNNNISVYNGIIQYAQLNPTSTKIKYKFIGIVNRFLEAADNGDILTPAGNRYKKSSFRGYTTLIIWIERYQSEFSTTIYITDVNPLFIEYFVTFLYKNNLTKNSVGTMLSKIKAILRRAYITGLTGYTGFGMKRFSEKSPTTYFSVSELKKIYHHPFTGAKAYIRDLLIMHCFLGMRVSDYFIFLSNPWKYLKMHEDKYFVYYISQKTNTEAVIPISYIVKKILLKYNYRFKSISPQLYNKYLKMVAYDAGIREKIFYNLTMGGVLTEFEKYKYEMVSSHTARRTFATVADLQEMPRANIMRMTGHNSESSFLTYIRHSNLESGLKVYNHPFFKIKL